MKVEIIKTENIGNLVEVRFRYWEDGACACGAKKATRTFETYPSTQQLINSI